MEYKHVVVNYPVLTTEREVGRKYWVISDRLWTCRRKLSNTYNKYRRKLVQGFIKSFILNYIKYT